MEKKCHKIFASLELFAVLKQISGIHWAIFILEKPSVSLPMSLFVFTPLPFSAVITFKHCISELGKRRSE